MIMDHANVSHLFRMILFNMGAICACLTFCKYTLFYFHRQFLCKMSSYKLVYFNGTGRAENTRMMFTLGGQKFEDVRISMDKWPSYRPGEMKIKIAKYSLCDCLFITFTSQISLKPVLIAKQCTTSVLLLLDKI